MFVGETLLYETGRVANILWLLLLHWLHVNHLTLLLRLGRCVHLTLVLADKLSRGLRAFSDLEERMLRMNSILLTVLAKVIIVTDRAHVADTYNRTSLTTIASDAFMLGVVLLDLLIVQVVGEHGAETTVTVLLNFLTDHRCHVRKLL